jgi:hypothetical protein
MTDRQTLTLAKLKTFKKIIKSLKRIRMKMPIHPKRMRQP